jgi:hypothetical protein
VHVRQSLNVRSVATFSANVIYSDLKLTRLQKETDYPLITLILRMAVWENYHPLQNYNKHNFQTRNKRQWHAMCNFKEVQGKYALFTDKKGNQTHSDILVYTSFFLMFQYFCASQKS